VKIRLIAAGTRLPDWIDEGVAEYARRFGRGLKFELVEIPLAREAERMRAALGRSNYVVALEVTGRAMSSPALAEWLAARMAGGKNVSLLIGGPDGLDPALSKAADLRWSLSSLTFPHGLARVIVAEQLYRAQSLLQGHPYHRA
jgi:23S rRNA (pseudouridine1915-N3)-methyltransferase